MAFAIHQAERQSLRFQPRKWADSMRSLSEKRDSDDGRTFKLDFDFFEGPSGFRCPKCLYVDETRSFPNTISGSGDKLCLHCYKVSPSRDWVPTGSASWGGDATEVDKERLREQEQRTWEQLGERLERRDSSGCLFVLLLFVALAAGLVSVIASQL